MKIHTRGTVCTAITYRIYEQPRVPEQKRSILGLHIAVNVLHCCTFAFVLQAVYLIVTKLPDIRAGPSSS